MGQQRKLKRTRLLEKRQGILNSLKFRLESRWRMVRPSRSRSRMTRRIKGPYHFTLINAAANWDGDKVSK
jgi:hypothetical protein